MKKKIYVASIKTLEQVAERGGRCPITGRVHSRGLEKMTFKNSFQPKLFYDTILLFYC